MMQQSTNQAGNNRLKHVEHIHRFEVIKSLGKGKEGEVFLAHDPQLGRQVAIKTLAPNSNNFDDLLQEARAISKLQHPNIVNLFDVGEHDYKPYLVYAYVEGMTLDQFIKSQKTLNFSQTAQMILALLDAIEYAHQQGMLHLNLKPSNIMINHAGQPLIMDFGLASTLSAPSSSNASNIPSSTSSYIAPEVATGKPATFSADLYSIGAILYEISTGHSFHNVSKAIEVLQQNADKSTTKDMINPQLEIIIRKSIAYSAQERYSNTTDMKTAFLAFLNPDSEDIDNQSNGQHSTLDFLMRRMRSKSDFPALSSTLSEINRVVDDDHAKSNALTKTILQDFSLTNKLLKLVNTAVYSQFGGKINTISKAVSILGFGTVRNIAMTLILFDFLQNKAQAAQLKDDVLAAFFAGIVAANISQGSHLRDAEEVMICSMFRNLGKMLASLYLFEESQDVARLVAQGDSEDKASIKILGISYNELGIGIAKSWNFPDRLLAGMSKLGGIQIAKPHTEIETLAVTVNLANDLCQLARNIEPKEKSKSLKQLIKRYEQALIVSEHDLNTALDKGLKDLASRASIINVDIAKSAMMKQVNAWSNAGLNLAKSIEPEKTITSNKIEVAVAKPINDVEAENLLQRQNASEAILNSGVQEITDTLVEDHELNDVIHMVLETMYRSGIFQRVMIMIRDSKTQQMTAKFGLGNDIDKALTKFHFQLNQAQDVFQLALEKGVDLIIEDVAASNIANKIPYWYRQAVSAKSFMLLPVIVKKNAVGLFYADMEQTESHQISQKQHALLRTLRNQAVLAIKQR